MSTQSAILTTTSLMSAVAPGVYAWWAGRKLIRSPDDPMLAEKYMAYQGRLYVYGVLALVAVFALASERLAPRLVPLLVLGVLAGAFPCRKALLGEGWSFTAYLEFRLRVLLAFAGFRLSLMLTPLLMAAAGEWRPQAGAALALLLLGWLFSGLGGFMALLGAKPLEDAETASGCQAVAAQSQAPMPALFCLEAAGGGVANAFAVSALPRSAVVFTRPLLERLAADETRAIFGHEMAHLEHMDGRFVRRVKLFSCALVALALLALPCLEALFGPGGLGFKSLLLAGVVLAFAQVRFIGHGRRHEAESDRRAVELCGNPEALVRALVKIHSLNRLPKRWDANTELMSTHPSLANRIRAIREAAGAGHEPLPGPVVLASTEPGGYAILESERIHWLEGVPPDTEPDPARLRERAASATAVVYGGLRELLVVPAKRQGAVLSAADLKGRKWKLPLRQEDIAKAQAALERIDPKVNQMVVGESWTLVVSSLLGLGILGAALAAMSAAVLLPLLPALGLLSLFGVVRPRSYVLGTLGLFGLGTGAAALLRLGLPEPGEGAAWVLLLLLCMSAFALALYRAGREPPQRGKDFWWLAAILACAALFGWLNLAAQDSAFLVFVSAQAHPGAATALLGLAGLVAAGGRRRRVLAPSLLCALAGLQLFLQSPYFGDRFAHDPFAVEPARPRWETVRLAPVRELDAPGFKGVGQSLRLSPKAGKFAFRDYQPLGYGGVRAFFVIAGSDGQRAEVEAIDLDFVDEERILALAGLPDGMEVRLLAARQGGWTVARRWPLPGIEAHSLDWNGEAGVWTVTGNKKDTDKLLKAVAGPEQDAAAVKEFPAVWPHFVAGDALLSAQPVGRPGSYGGSWLAMLYALGGDGEDIPFFEPGKSYRVFSISEGSNWRAIAQTAQPFVDCLPVSQAAGGVASVPCLAYDLARQRVGLFRPDTGRMSSVVELPGRSSGTMVQQGGRLYLKAGNSRVLALDLADPRAYDLQLTAAEGYASAMAVAGRRLAVASLVSGGSAAKLRIFEMPAW